MGKWKYEIKCNASWEQLLEHMGTWGTHWEYTWELDGNMGSPSLHPPTLRQGGRGEQKKRRRKVGPPLGYVGAHEISFLKIVCQWVTHFWPGLVVVPHFRVVGYLTYLFTNLITY
jgi:hypothetical protein